MENQLREAQEMLFLKQGELNRASSENQAQKMSLEASIQRYEIELQRLRNSTNNIKVMQSSHDTVIPFDALGETYHKLINNKRVGKAIRRSANFLDSNANKIILILK